MALIQGVEICDAHRKWSTPFQKTAVVLSRECQYFTAMAQKIMESGTRSTVTTFEAMAYPYRDNGFILRPRSLHGKKFRHCPWSSPLPSDGGVVAGFDSLVSPGYRRILTKRGVFSSLLSY